LARAAAWQAQAIGFEDDGGRPWIGLRFLGSIYLERAESEACGSRSADRSIRGAENSLGPAKTDGLLRPSCLQSSQRPPMLLHLPRQPLG